MSALDRIARWPVLNWALELAGVVVLLGAGAVIASSVRARIESAVPPCVAVREVPDGQLSDNPLRQP